MKKVIAIMQPTFLPWIGYFAMIDQVDSFVFLDSVKFSKRSWQQRNRIKSCTGELMLTVPVLTKGKVDQLINEVKISELEDFKRKLLQSIQMNYSKAKYFDCYFPTISKIIESSSDSLVQLNISLIEIMMKELKIPLEKLLKSSSLNVDGKKADLLVSICQNLEAKHYVSAPGSQEYIEESKAFEIAGIEVEYQVYNHPQYGQLYGEFLPYMSIIDLLFNEGENSLKIIRSGLELNQKK